jgi:hypothetical protein
MKKTVIAFLVAFVFAFCGFAYLAQNEVDTNAAISKSPGFVLATPEGITKTTRKGSNYRVNYSYLVAGIAYKIDSKPMGKADAQTVFDGANVEVAYYTEKPSIAVLRRDYEQRDRTASKAGAIRSVVGLSLMMALATALTLSWACGWLRRGRA